MRIEIERLGGGPISFEDFLKKQGLTIKVTERGIEWFGTEGQFFASAPGVEVMVDGCLLGEYGNGRTPVEAVADYRRRLRGKRIAIGAYTPERREIRCPTEWL